MNGIRWREHRAAVALVLTSFLSSADARVGRMIETRFVRAHAARQSVFGPVPPLNIRVSNVVAGSRRRGVLLRSCPPSPAFGRRLLLYFAQQHPPPARSWQQWSVFAVAEQPAVQTSEAGGQHREVKEERRAQPASGDMSGVAHPPRSARAVLQGRRDAHRSTRSRTAAMGRKPTAALLVQARFPPKPSSPCVGRACRASRRRACSPPAPPRSGRPRGTGCCGAGSGTRCGPRP